MDAPLSFTPPLTWLRNNQVIQNTVVSSTPLTVKAASGQTADVFDVKNSAGLVLFGVDPSGNLTIAGTATITVNEAVTGTLTVSSTVAVTGASTLTGAVSLGSTLSVTGASTLIGNVSVSNTLTTTNLTVLGVTSFNNITSTGSITFNSGSAITANSYQISRDNANPNNLYFNVPSGTGFIFGVNNQTTTLINSLGQVAMSRPASQSVTAGTINAQSVSDNCLVLSGGLDIYGGTVRITITNTGGGANQKIFEFYNFSNNLLISRLNDTVAVRTTYVTIADLGNISFTQAVNTSGSPAAFTITGGAHTTLANADLIEINANLARTVQFSGQAGIGTITNYRGVYIQGATLQTAGAGAETITNASTLELTGITASAANGGVTITNNAILKANLANGAKVYILNSAGSPSNSNPHIYLLGESGLKTATLYINDASSVFALGTGSSSTTINIFNSTNNAISIDPKSNITFAQLASTSGTPTAITINPAANTGITLSTEVSQFILSASTQTWATGALTTERYVQFGQPTFAFAAASTLTNAVNVDIATPVAGSNATFSNTFALRAGSSATIGATAAGMIYASVAVPAHTITVTGTTQVTSQDWSGLRLDQITYTDASAVTVDSAATMIIVGAPIAAGSVTLTKTYALNVKAGVSWFQGQINGSSAVLLGSGQTYGFSSNSNPNSATVDTNISRNAAGVLQIGTTAANASGSLKAAQFGPVATTLTLGVGATTFALTSDCMTITGDAGTNTIATMTGGLSGEIVTLVFADALVTITNNGAAPAANQFDLSAAFTSALHKSLTVRLVAAGYWVEVARSTNT